MKESLGMCVKLSHKDVHDRGVYNSKMSKKRERGEKKPKNKRRGKGSI